VDEFVAEHGSRVIVHADDEQGGLPDLDALLAGFEGHVYVCGPEPLLNAMIQRVPAQRLHFERFSAVDRDAGESEPFEVTLSRSRNTITVGKVRVLKGTPVHLDSVMSDEDKDAIGVMYPCISRSIGKDLVLDI
jgi:ferredoxin-NADP reductase